MTNGKVGSGSFSFTKNVPTLCMLPPADFMPWRVKAELTGLILSQLSLNKFLEEVIRTLVNKGIAIVLLFHLFGMILKST